MFPVVESLTSVRNNKGLKALERFEKLSRICQECQGNDRRFKSNRLSDMKNLGVWCSARLGPFLVNLNSSRRAMLIFSYKGSLCLDRRAIALARA